MNYEELTQKIVELSGGRENIVAVMSCMTRLRLKFGDKEKVRLEEIKQLEGVLGILETDTDTHIVLGPGKAKSACEVLRRFLGDTDAKKIATSDAEALHAEIRAKNATPGKLLLRRIARIFIPLIPGFIACGLITGCLGLVARIEPSLADSALWKLLAVAGGSVFWCMNVLAGASAAKEFGGSPVLGAVLGAFISHPGLKDVHFLGDNLDPGRGGVIAAVMVGVFAAWLEKNISGRVPRMFEPFLTPLLTVLIGSLFTAVLFGPIGGAVSAFLGETATFLVYEGGSLAGALLGGLWLPIVMLGLHHTFTPIHVDLLANYGVTILLPILAMAGAGQVGASFAVFLKTKNERLKRITVSALPAGMLGVGEPLIYGVTLPLGRPFVAACVGGAAGGAVVAAKSIGAYSIGISGLTLTPATTEPLFYLAGIGAAYAVGFSCAWLLGFDDPIDEE